MMSGHEWDQLTWDEQLKRIVAETGQLAASMLSKYLLPIGQETSTWVILDDEKRYVSDEVPQYLRDVITYVHLVRKWNEAVDTDEISKLAYFAGMLAPGVWLVADKKKTYAEVIASFGQVQSGRIIGGSKKLLTDEEEVLALSIIGQRKTVGVSITSACTRAAADLLKEHNIKVGAKTLSRIWNKSKQ